MSPKVVKAWSCSVCNKTFAHNEHGKLFAEACCTCRACGGGPTLYLGTNQAICRQCAQKKELASAEENLKHAQERLKRARMPC